MADADANAPREPRSFGLQPVARRVALAGIGEVGAKIVAFLPAAYLARVAGPEGFGVLAYATAVIAQFILVVDFGLSVYGVRELARGAPPARFTGEVLSVRLLLAIAAAVLLFAALPFIGKNPLETSVIAWSGWLILSFAAGLTWVFQGIEMMGVVALAGTLTQIAYAGGVIAAVRGPEDIARVPVAQAAAEIGVALYLLLLLARRGDLPRLGLAASRAREILRASFPLGVGRVLRVFLYSVDTLILGALVAHETLGLFSAASRVVFALLTINVFLGTALLPRISRAKGEDAAIVSRLVTRLGYATTTVTLPAALGISLLARPILTLLFGDEFAGAAATLAIFAWAILVIPLGENFRRILWAFDKQAHDARSLAIAVVVKSALCFALIPRFGVAGVAAAVIVSEFILLALSMSDVRRAVVAFQFLSVLRAPIVAALAMTAVVLPARRLGLAPAIAAGAVAYIGALALQRGIPEEIFARARRAEGTSGT